MANRMCEPQYVRPEAMLLSCRGLLYKRQKTDREVLNPITSPTAIETVAVHEAVINA